MRVFVHCDATGNILSVAIPNQDLGDQLHMQTDDDGDVHTVDVDDKAILPADVTGENGPDAQQKAYEKLRALMPRK